jgi:beta-glucanase (GH16 family)
MKRAYISFFIITIVFFSCTRQKNSPPVLLPSNLNVDIQVSNTIEGLVNVSASADAANYYSVEFFNENGSSVIESNDGSAFFQYTESNDYKIIVRAHATFDNYIEQEDSVSIIITEIPGGSSDEGYTTPLSYSGYDLVWNDEFDGTALSSDWTFEIGSGGWGNNELQYYRSQNTEVTDGYLVITAKNELYGGSNYTSSRIVTKDLQSFQYGRVDIRAKLPQGKGIWPALWMLGNSFTTIGWPACGEIDIMEMVGNNFTNEGNNTIYGTAHWDNNGSYAQFGGQSQLSSGKYSDEFHVFSIIWDSNSIKWYRDDNLFQQIDISVSGLSEFQEAFFFIFNVAVGGNWPGNPNSSTPFPQEMKVDYIRVFQ